jgi:predicted DNA-binding antitoxin AbrB/MazE fold protein
MIFPKRRFQTRPLRAQSRFLSLRVRTTTLLSRPTNVEAVYENGLLHPLQPLLLPEHARVRVSVESVEEDTERAAWLAQSRCRLLEIRENDSDDVFNELLSR